MTLPPATTINGQVEAIVQAIYDAAADRPRPASIDEKSTFKYRIDRWTPLVTTSLSTLRASKTSQLPKPPTTVRAGDGRRTALRCSRARGLFRKASTDKPDNR
jgi:hypothetical protein